MDQLAAKLYLTNALDLAHDSQLPRAPGKWETELRAVMDKCGFGLASKERLDCPACSYAFESELPDWCRSPVYVGKSQWLAVRVLSRVWEICPACRQKLSPRKLGDHAAGCQGKTATSQEKPTADGSDAADAAREERVRLILFDYWKRVLHYGNPELHRVMLADLLDRFRSGADAAPVLLQQLTAVGVPVNDFSYPAPIRTVLARSETHTKGYSTKATYVSLVTFLRHLLCTALRRGYLNEREFKSRDDTLEFLEANARAAVIRKSADGVFFEMEERPESRADFPPPNKPDLYGTYSAYMESPLRRRLLARIANLKPETTSGRTFKHPSGLEMLSPTCARNFLALEVFLRQGTTAEAVLSCTYGQFQELYDDHSDRPSGFIAANKEYHWTSSWSERPNQEVLRAEGSVVRAIKSYAACLRPAFFKDHGPDSTDHLPLFPLQGGAAMHSLVSSIHLLFKICERRPPNVEVSHPTVRALKEEIVKEARIKQLLARSGPGHN